MFTSDSRVFVPHPIDSEAFVATILTPAKTTIRVAPGEVPAPALSKKAVSQIQVFADEPSVTLACIDTFGDFRTPGVYKAKLNFQADNLELQTPNISFERLPASASILRVSPREYAGSGYYAAVLVDGGTCLVRDIAGRDRDIWGFTRVHQAPTDLVDVALSIAPEGCPTDWRWLCYLTKTSLLLVDGSPLDDSEVRREYPPIPLATNLSDVALVSVIAADEPGEDRPSITVAYMATVTGSNQRALCLIACNVSGEQKELSPISLPSGTIRVTSVARASARIYIAVVSEGSTTYVHRCDIPWGGEPTGFSLVETITDGTLRGSDVRLCKGELWLGILLQTEMGWVRRSASLENVTIAQDERGIRLAPLHPPPHFAPYRVRLDATGNVIVIGEQTDTAVVYGPFDVVPRVSISTDSTLEPSVSGPKMMDVISRPDRPLMLVAYTQARGPTMFRI